MKNDAEHFTITIRSEPGFRGNVIDRLRPFLKLALRRFGLRCVSIVPKPPAPPKETR